MIADDGFCTCGSRVPSVPPPPGLPHTSPSGAQSEAARCRWYRHPIKGSDPQGWAAALNHFNGGSGYRVRADYKFQRAIHAAAQRIRLTGHPVGLLVETGNHAWVMSGFKATADPALTNNFTVTAVYVEGPLFPKQQAYGYDMAPDSRLSMARLRTFFRRYDDRHNGTGWDNHFVTIQP